MRDLTDESIYHRAMVDAQRDELTSLHALTDELAEALREACDAMTAIRYQPYLRLNERAQIGNALLRGCHFLARYDEARARREGTTHDATCYELGPLHYECALAEIERQGKQSAVMQEDMRDLLNALGLYSGARPESPHRVMRDVVIPAVEQLRAVGRVVEGELPDLEWNPTEDLTDDE
jgi:hypothetical protein